MMFIVWKLSLSVKTKLYDEVVLLTVTYGPETWGMCMDESHTRGLGNEVYADFIWIDMDR